MLKQVVFLILSRYFFKVRNKKILICWEFSSKITQWAFKTNLLSINFPIHMLSSWRPISGTLDGVTYTSFLAWKFRCCHRNCQSPAFLFLDAPIDTTKISAMVFLAFSSLWLFGSARKTNKQTNKTHVVLCLKCNNLYQSSKSGQ